VKKIWIFIFSLLFIFCVGCSSEHTNDNNFNDSFSDKKEESVIEPPNLEDSSKEETSDDVSSNEKEDTDKGDSSEGEPSQEDKDWTGIY